MSQANITRSSAGVSSNVGPSYSTDYLASLKASTMSAPPRQGIEQDTGDLSGSNGGLIIGSYDNDDQVGLDQGESSMLVCLRLKLSLNDSQTTCLHFCQVLQL